MMVISRAVMVIFLGICSWMDIRKRSIYVWIIAMFGIIGAVLGILCKPISCINIMAGIVVGVATMLVSRWSKGGIGMGDGMVLCITGIYLGGYKNLSLLLAALILAACWSVGILVLKKGNRKTKIPFLPFLLTAYVGMLL